MRQQLLQGIWYTAELAFLNISILEASSASRNQNTHALQMLEQHRLARLLVVGVLHRVHCLVVRRLRREAAYERGVKLLGKGEARGVENLTRGAHHVRNAGTVEHVADKRRRARRDEHTREAGRLRHRVAYARVAQHMGVPLHTESADKS